MNYNIFIYFYLLKLTRLACSICIMTNIWFGLWFPYLCYTPVIFLLTVSFLGKKSVLNQYLLLLVFSILLFCLSNFFHQTIYIHIFLPAGFMLFLDKTHTLFHIAIYLETYFIPRLKPFGLIRQYFMDLYLFILVG